MFNGRRQPSCGGTSRMTRECQVRICEGLGVKFPGPTRQPINAVTAAWKTYNAQHKEKLSEPAFRMRVQNAEILYGPATRQARCRLPWPTWLHQPALSRAPERVGVSRLVA